MRRNVQFFRFGAVRRRRNYYGNLATKRNVGALVCGINGLAEMLSFDNVWVCTAVYNSLAGVMQRRQKCSF